MMLRVLVACITVFAAHCAWGAPSSKIATLPQLFSGEMLPSLAVETISHCDRLLPIRTVRIGASSQELARRTANFPAIQFDDRGKRVDLYDYIASNRVAGLLVLKNGEIAFEDYELGAGPKTRWCSFSMAKSVASTLLGAAVRLPDCRKTITFD